MAGTRSDSEVEHRPDGPRGRQTPARRGDLVWTGGALVAAAAVFVLVRGALIDDAYITLSYARTLAEHLHWGLTPFHTANSATSPLNVLLLGAATAALRGPVLALGVVFVLLTGGQMWIALRLARLLDLPRTFAALAVALVLFSPLMLSSVGMEMTLAVTLLLALTAAAAAGRPVAFGAVGGLLVLTRIDLAVFVLVLAVAVPAVRRRLLPAAGTALAVVAPWYVFSWIALGALVPDTLVIKTLGSNAWGDWFFRNGALLYLDRYPTATVLTAVPALLGALAVVAYPLARAWRSPAFRGLGPVIALGAGGIAHFAAYCLLAPPPFHWYYAPSTAACSIVLAAVVCAPLRTADPAAGPARLLRWALPAVPLLLLVADAGFAATRGLPWNQAVITTNWALPAQYAAIGQDLRGRDLVVASPGEIGSLAFFCRCDIVDVFADRAALAPLIHERWEEAGSVMRLLLQVNFANRGDVGPAATPDAFLYYSDGPPPPQDGWSVWSYWLGRGSFRLETR
jgi:hypothetical protein